MTDALLRSCQVYWGYWGVMFGTLLTWIFAVAAAADDALISYNSSYTGTGLSYSCPWDDTICDICECRMIWT